MSYESEPEPPRPDAPPPPPAYHYPPPGYGYPYYPPPQRPYNGMSIAALVVGIVGACNPIGVLALIFGLIAKRQIRETGEQGEGFAVTGIVMGWIGVASVVFWVLYVLVVFSIWVPFVQEVSDPANWPTPDPSDFPT
ncbi:MAG TPA: DUF4190 domain-containing protein [Glycomyces sp.]|nr:DUF4190 domain-containing protein [Glycomyces sp.]